MGESVRHGDAGQEFLDEVRSEFRKWHDQCLKVLDQLQDADIKWAPDPESNSIGTIVKHVSGNLRSRFRDFLTTDGEKPDRNRDGEFESPPTTVSEATTMWNEGWSALLGELDRLAPEDLARTVTIRNEPHTVPQALLRSLAHTANHVGQIIWIGKHRAGERWQTLSIPRGKSGDYVSRPPV